MNPPSCIIRLAIQCITFIATASILVGGFLLWKGYGGGDVLIGIAGTAVGGLVGMISMRQAPPPPPPDTTATQTITTVTTPNPPTA